MLSRCLVLTIFLLRVFFASYAYAQENGTVAKYLKRPNSGYPARRENFQNFSKKAVSQQSQYLFHVKVNSDGINIRTDSTPSADIICKAGRGELLNVLAEAYDWYKINLPKSSAVFIKKDLVSLNEDNKSAKVNCDNVNIRLRPDLDAPIVGKVKQDTTVVVIEQSDGWYKIEPPESSFGWIYKKFVDKIEYNANEPPKIEETATAAEINKEEIPVIKDTTITLIGVIKPKTFISTATHKMLDENNKLYLLKSPKISLDAFNYHKAKVRGIPDDKLSNAKYTVITVDNIEVIN